MQFIDRLKRANRARHESKAFGEAIDRRIIVLREKGAEIATSDVDDRFKGILTACQIGGFGTLVHLPHEVAGGTSPSNPQHDLYEAMVRLATDDDVFWTAFAYTQWGFVANLSALMWPDGYYDVLEIAEAALGPVTEDEEHICDLGPFVNLEQCLPYLSDTWREIYLDEDQEMNGEARFYAAILDIVLEAVDRPNVDQLFSEVVAGRNPDGEPGNYWTRAWSSGSDEFGAVMDSVWPEWRIEIAS